MLATSLDFGLFTMWAGGYYYYGIYKFSMFDVSINAANNYNI